MEVSATGPELHLDVSALQRNVMLLEVSTLQGPKLHLDVSALKRSVLLLEVSATGPELNLDVSALGKYRMCLIHRDQYILTAERVRCHRA